MKILETERLILREIVEADAEFIYDLVNQLSFIKNIGNRNIYTIERARDVIENRYRQSYKQFGYGLWAVELKENGAPIGFCGFIKRDFLPDADIGFAFLPQYERRAYAFESASAAMRYGRERLNLTRVLAITSKDNEASCRLLEKLGFRFERFIKMPDAEEDIKLYSND
ncbi:MAG TPA: GNAT family N-acetyltransferase [Pyrinomonadaceae bacterium]|nr:GNAT family N-acetyltransferase [Pyrinomonadaceae bacterium]